MKGRQPPEPLRVLHVITRLIVGGAQENTLLTAEGLNRMEEYEVTLAVGVDGGREGDLLDRAREDLELVVVSDLVRSVRPISDLKALAGLYRLIRSGRYDIVHTHSSKAGVLGRLAAWLAGTPIIVHTLHSLVFHDYQPWLVNRAWWAIKRTCAPLTDHYLSVADAISEKAIAEGIAPAERFTTVYSGMELDWFLSFAGERDAARTELGIPLDAPVVGKVARLSPLKGHEQLLDAASAIVSAHPAVRFLLVGDGDLHEYVRARASSLGISDNFVLPGLMPRERIPEMLAAMDVVVHTSLREGLPRALPQALAMGKPCVAVDLDGAPEVVLPGQTGFLVPPKDASALAESVSGLLSDRELCARMGEAGRTLVDPAFRTETMVERTAHVYERLAERKRDKLDRFRQRKKSSGRRSRPLRGSPSAG